MLFASIGAMPSNCICLYAGTIEDNIAYGRYGRCSREEVEEAARAANAHDFISGASRTTLMLKLMHPVNSPNTIPMQAMAPL